MPLITLKRANKGLFLPQLENIIDPNLVPETGLQGRKPFNNSNLSDSVFNLSGRNIKRVESPVSRLHTPPCCNRACLFNANPLHHAFVLMPSLVVLKQADGDGSPL